MTYQTEISKVNKIRFEAKFYQFIRVVTKQFKSPTLYLNFSFYNHNKFGITNSGGKHRISLHSM